jgi:spore maturation protein CgeB
MRLVLFYHSLISDWNHGNAHFLRGVAAELIARGHDVHVYEPDGGWSLTNLLTERGMAAIDGFQRAFPTLHSTRYREETLDFDKVLDRADVVIAHEWNSKTLLAGLTRHRAGTGRYQLLFHDTHHRAVSDPDALAELPIEGFDGVLAFGGSLRDQYQRLGWGRRVWVWHEAADTRVFQPIEGRQPAGDVTWIGNWGDDERASEIGEFLMEPVKSLGIRGRVHGVRYPETARENLAAAGIDYAGWVPNYEVPRVFGAFTFTVHIPRGPYVRILPGIPTIRPFEAMACGIPLISSPWDDVEGLFAEGDDYIKVRSGREMIAAMREVLHDHARRASLVSSGLHTIRARHTCAHRVDELMAIVGDPLNAPAQSTELSLNTRE